jgi:predicted branched-subunit amino acid permease
LSAEIFDDPPPSLYRSTQDAWLGGAREACGAAGIVLAASYIGFGSLIRQNGLGLDIGILSTLSAWALPGQVALVELYGIGASLLVQFIAVSLTNLRLMPMTLSLMPVLRVPGRPAWKLYAAAHLIAVTGWAVAMLRCPELPRAQRLPFFLGFATTLWAASLAGTAIGFFAAGAVPPPVSLGLVFVNPLYFMLLLLLDLRARGRRLSVVFGAIAGPLLHLVTPTWGLLLTGVLAGTLAYLVDRYWKAPA